MGGCSSRQRVTIPAMSKQRPTANAGVETSNARSLHLDGGEGHLSAAASGDDARVFTSTPGQVTLSQRSEMAMSGSNALVDAEDETGQKVNFLQVREELLERARTATSTVDDAAIEEFFKNYADAPKGVVQDSRIEHGGFKRLLDDINVGMESKDAWVVLFIFNAASVGVLTRSDFVRCAKERGISDRSALHETIQREVKELNRNITLATSFLKFCFGIIRESNYDRTVAFEDAIPILAVLVDCYPLGLPFLRFLKVYEKEAGRSKNYITQDQWSMLAPFMLKYDISNLHLYSSEDAWPTLFDDFVEWIRNPHMYDAPEEEYESDSTVASSRGEQSVNFLKVDSEEEIEDNVSEK